MFAGLNGSGKSTFKTLPGPLCAALSMKNLNSCKSTRHTVSGTGKALGEAKLKPDFMLCHLPGVYNFQNDLYCLLLKAQES